MANGAIASLTPTVEYEESINQEPIVTPKPKTKPKTRGVRFQTDEGDIVLPERVNRFERPSSRSKAGEALDYLLAGNRRFREGKLERCIGGPEIVTDTAEEVAKPSTVILSCSDSRVPPELVCDMGLGDTHVIRIGGNVVNDFILGSIIFAVQHLECPLVVVLAHSRCSVVASAVQKWARNKSSQNIHHDQEARSLAETVQRTLGTSPSESLEKAKQQEIQKATLQSGTNSPSHSSSQIASPFQNSDSRTEGSEEKQDQGFLSRCCSCFGQPAQPQPEVQMQAPGTISGASTPMRTKGEGLQERGRGSSVGSRGQSMDRASHRNFIRQSINPLNALVGAIGGVVESVASSGQHKSLDTIVKRESQKEDKGYDSDDEDLKRGLQKQDSLEFTRARLARSRNEKRMEALRSLSERDDVDCIIDENAKVSANTILKGIVKNLDPDTVRNVEVVAAKYDIANGEVKILSRNWYSSQQHTYYSTPS